MSKILCSNYPSPGLKEDLFVGDIYTFISTAWDNTLSDFQKK